MKGSDMSRTRRCVLAAAAMLLVSVEGVPADAPPATQPREAPAKPKVVLPLARVAKQPLRTYTMAQLHALFPAFEHEPFETAGFSHLTLPFHYDDPDGGGDANEAYAFAMLLSESLDWGPGCYCSRHAYFVFKRARAHMAKLAREYDPALIRYVVKDWQATHAVGGLLVHHEAGYSGTLLVYDRLGRVVQRTGFLKPRGYFELLGDMAVEALIALGHTPSETLVKHLHIRRCKHHRSLIDLGRAASVKERSKEEFALYDAILKRDPGFADVWFWVGNQKWWMDSDVASRSLHEARALSGYLHAVSLADFVPDKCPDKALAAKYDGWLMQAEQMVGPDSPLVVEQRLEQACRTGRIAPAFLASATRVAARYPNDYGLLFTLGRVYSGGGKLPADCDMGASIALAARRNRFMTGQGHKHSAIADIACNAHHLGCNDVCVHLLLPMATKMLKDEGEKSIRWPAWMLGKALFEMGRFDESWRWYRTAFKGYGPHEERGVESLVEGAVAAAHAGRTDVVRQILRDRGAVLRKHHAEGVVRSYLLLLDGKPMDDPAVWSAGRPGTYAYWLLRQQEIVTMQSHLLHKKRMPMHRPNEWVGKNMYSPVCRILAHASYQKHPDRRVDCLYEAMEWLSPSDSWVRQVVGEWRRDVPNPKFPDPDEVLKRLTEAGYRPLRHPQVDPARARKAWKFRRSFAPGTMAWCIRKLLDVGDYDKAEKLARCSLHLAVASGGFGTRVHANHLIHLIARARRATKGMVSPDDL